jgi:poly(3-hydroxybutyrate) depolymerase
MKKILVIANFLLNFFSCNKGGSGRAPDKASEQKTVNLTIDGNARSFIIYLPAGFNNAGKMPLIFVVHGGSGTP